MPWDGIDIVLECTGKFTKRADAIKHIEAGAKIGINFSSGKR